MRRLTILHTALLVMLVLASGVALAADFIGTAANDTLVGTEGDDYLKRVVQGTIVSTPWAVTT